MDIWTLFSRYWKIPRCFAEILNAFSLNYNKQRWLPNWRLRLQLVDWTLFRKRTFLKKDCKLDDSRVLNMQFNVKMLHQPKQFEQVFISFRHMPFMSGKQGYWLNEILIAVENMVLNHYRISAFTLYYRKF